MDNDNGSTNVEITKIAPLREVDKDTQLVTYVKSGTPKTKNGIVFDVPSTDEESKDRYNCDLAYLIRAGVRNLSHHVIYEGTHEEMQAAADAYKVGTRGTGVGRKTIKKVEAERDAALAIALKMGEESGLDADQIRAMVEEYNSAE